MKRFVALIGGSLFLVGLPLVLILTGVTPVAVASALVDAVTVRNPVQLGMQIGLLGLWSTWLWGFGSVIKSHIDHRIHARSAVLFKITQSRLATYGLHSRRMRH